jgi:hypothetical protein
MRLTKEQIEQWKTEFTQFPIVGQLIRELEQTQLEKELYRVNVRLLTFKVQELREGLEWYASPDRYCRVENETQRLVCIAEDPPGETARRALNGTK